MKTFKAAPGIKVRGVCQFFLKRMAPPFELYCTPVQIDPDKPIMPISQPVFYSSYLARLYGTYATLGLAEDTWSLSEKLMGEDGFLAQAYEIHNEREKMFFDALDRVKQGLIVCVFDGPDRIQHMFWRFIDDKHPALTDEQRRRFDEDGFFLVEDALTPAETAELLAVVDARYAAHKRERHLGDDEAFQMRNVAATDPVFLRLVDHPRILPLVVDLMGVNVQLRTSHAHVRPPQSEEVAAHQLGAPDSFFPWHSDGPNFGWPRVQGLLPFMEMKVGYYLTDLTRPNSGEICVVRGSHLSTQPVGTDGERLSQP